eukprot:scaffold36667_cov35-Tisochrysis_lutea.AAC.3
MVHDELYGIHYGLLPLLSVIGVAKGIYGSDALCRWSLAKCIWVSAATNRDKDVEYIAVQSILLCKTNNVQRTTTSTLNTM